MAENFYTILTATGKAKLANSAVLGSKVNFKTLKVGDGKGSYYEPSENQTSLVNQVWSGNIGSISVDENNPNWIVIETLIPATIGGFFIREAGIFDEDDDLIAISKLSETYKPVVSEGSIKDLCIKIILEVSNVESVTLKIDPTVIVATRKDIQVLQVGMDNIKQELLNLERSISNPNVISKNVAFGMNNVIKNNTTTSLSPKFTIQGKHYINMLGKDGNCEDVSKWKGTYQATVSLDGANKVFGSNGIKIAITSNQGNTSKALSAFNIDITKYYLLSAYLKNGNASTGITIMKDSSGGGVGKGLTASISDTTKFTRVGIILQPSDFGTTNNLTISVSGTSGQYGYVDGIMINEITAIEYSLGATSLLDKYPYVDSYACLTNPYIEVKHDNLVRNGNGEEGVSWWTPIDSNDELSVVDGKFSFTGTVANNYIYQMIDVKPNTDYYISADYTGQGFIEVDSHINGVFTTIRMYNGTFNTGNSTQIAVFMRNSTISTNQFSHIMMVEGTMQPALYKLCRIERCVIEGRFTDDDSITYDNGEIKGSLKWKHKTLLGKDYNWQYQLDYNGFKRFFAKIIPHKIVPYQSVSNQTLIKYDGKLCKVDVTSATSDTFVLHGSNTVWDGECYICASDIDTGWAENILPNADEVKAYMNGWKAIAYNNYEGTSRYVAWKSVVDSTIINPYTTLTSEVTNSNVIPVVDSSKFAVNDIITICDGNSLQSTAKITAINGNNITITSTLSWISGLYFVKCDSSSSSATLNYCKNNVANAYTGYQLHYRLANPEPITNINCHVHGDIPLIKEGDNYVFIDSGVVLGEVANPSYDALDKCYQINNKWQSSASNFLKSSTELINTVYKNGIFSRWTVRSSVDINSYGKSDAYLSESLYDTTATYTVDYKILATQAPQVGTIRCSYNQDISTAINDLYEEVNSKQTKDSIIDELVDLSVYEKYDSKNSKWSSFNWISEGNSLILQVEVPLVPKKTIPKITINSCTILYGIGGNYITDKFSIWRVDSQKQLTRIGFLTNDATTISNVKACGAHIYISITADCKGRI